MKKYILPNHASKTRATFVAPKAIIGYIMFLVAITFLSGGVLKFGSGVLGYATNIDINVLLEGTNTIRKKNNLSGLSINNKLSKAAEAKANDMFVDDYWAHTAPDGTEPWDFIKAYGYEYSYAGENLAVDFTDSEDVLQAWYDSPGHRENLVSSNYTEIGFAVVNGELNGRKTTLVVQMFGKPSNLSPAILADSRKIEVTSESLINEALPEAKDLALQESNANLNINTEDNQAGQNLVEKNLVETNQVEKNQQAPVTNNNNGLQLANLNQNDGSVLNSTDVLNVSRNIALILGFFVTIIFAVDGYYVRAHQIYRVTGHTILHVLMLLIAIIGIWYTQVGLVL